MIIKGLFKKLPIGTLLQPLQNHLEDCIFRKSQHGKPSFRVSFLEKAGSEESVIFPLLLAKSSFWRAVCLKRGLADLIN